MVVTSFPVTTAAATTTNTTAVVVIDAADYMGGRYLLSVRMHILIRAVGSVILNITIPTAMASSYFSCHQKLDNNTS